MSAASFLGIAGLVSLSGFEILSVFWRGFTTRGAQASMIVGTLSTLLLICFSQKIQVDILKAPAAWFPLRNPGLVTIPLSFLVGIVVSLAVPEPEAVRRFAEVEHRIHFGD
jgi:cation/acetate symporter